MWNLEGLSSAFFHRREKMAFPALLAPSPMPMPSVLSISVRCPETVAAPLGSPPRARRTLPPALGAPLACSTYSNWGKLLQHFPACPWALRETGSALFLSSSDPAVSSTFSSTGPWSGRDSRRHGSRTRRGHVRIARRSRAVPLAEPPVLAQELGMQQA